jgi:PTS system mannose-specific IIB component
MILQLRVDERLVHGQVCSTWINTLGATHLLVANDQLAGDDFQKEIMSMGIPSGVKCLFTTLEKAVGILNSPKASGLRILLIAQTPKDALYLVKNSDSITELNIANYGSIVKSEKEPEVIIGRNVILDEDDVSYLKEIQDMGKTLYRQDIVGSNKKMLKF